MTVQINGGTPPRDGKRGKYAEFTLSRTFRNGEAFKYATTFRARDGQALREIIEDTVKWMEGEGFESALNGTEGSESGEQAADKQAENARGGDEVEANG